ncbi:EAL and GGDEF domain-containing protein [Sphaerotilus mobilis]|uniref:PAS domain S-box-containing protein/diguanylate cyclase (GGDEF)-like protein n=1 Tax=Sphaerotilus mobilis TaxID=47994 RepID=A0A4Q7LG03_9BURK|nr:EAL domain-containing protein [Sphaerotilus mobilis]RZS52951.1 PAS domain S-box-containing protein/diguanylate cyclase (GGDEF)-like protein [Sphaerotilus mobilis]
MSDPARAAAGAALVFATSLGIAALGVTDPNDIALSAWLQAVAAGLLAGVLILLALHGRQQARDDQARQRELIEMADVGMSLTESDGRLAQVNRRYAEIVGRSVEQLLTLRFQDLTHPDDLDSDLTQMAELLARQIPYYRMQKRYLRLDGSSVWVLLTVTLAQSSGRASGLARRVMRDEPPRFISTIQDISELRQTQDALQHQRTQLEQVIRGIPDCLTMRDIDGRYQLVNPAAERLIGRPAAEILGKRAEEVYRHGVMAETPEIDRRVIDRGEPVRHEARLSGDNGALATIDLVISPLVGPDQRPYGVISVGRDVTHERHNLRLLEQASHRNRELLTEAERSRLALLSLLEDQRDAQAALSASEARLRAVVAALPDLIFLFDAQTRLIDIWSSSDDNLLGPREAFIGQRLSEFLPHALAALATEEIRAALEHGKGQPFEYSLTLPAGERWYEMRTARVGHDVALGVARDITREREARQAQRRTEDNLLLAVEGTGDGLWDWDLISDNVGYSVAFERLLRYEGQTPFSARFLFRDRLHPDDRERCVNAVRDAIKQGIRFDATYRLMCFDGEYRWFQGRGMCHRAPDGQPLRFSGVLSDLSDRLRDEERLRLAAQVLDSTQEGVMITNAQRRIVSVNRAFTTLLGYTEAEVLGRTPRMLSSGRHEAAFYDAIWAELDQTGQWKGEIWNRRKDGELMPELLSISAVHDITGAISHYVGVFADISRMKDSEARLEFLAHHDPLTRLPNRLLFNQQMEQALHQAQREHRRLAVLLLDLDRFKDINDSYGHLAGDELLQHVAQRLTGRLRQSDTLARLGGDEFALLMHDLRYDDDAARLASELLGALSQPWRSSDGVEVNVGVSIGICIYPDHGQTSQALLQGADAALYRAKGDGRGVYRYYADEMTQSARERLHLETRLRRALVDDQLVLHYQPQVELQTGRIVGAEALVRWMDPEHGLIPPGRFIPVAETTGLIGDIGAWVLAEACRQGKAWLDEGLPPLTLAVNVSPRQFRHADLAAQVMQTLIETGLPAEQLELELTEGALMEREQEALDVLQRLRAIGVGVAIDDFGTGYSSLAYLKRFPLDVLKIDRSFIADIPNDPDDMEIAAAVIAMGHSLGIRVLAEGVETVDQLAFLRFKHCDRYQGFLCSRPVPPDEFAALLRAQITRADNEDPQPFDA